MKLPSDRYASSIQVQRSLNQGQRNHFHIYWAELLLCADVNRIFVYKRCRWRLAFVCKDAVFVLSNVAIVYELA